MALVAVCGFFVVDRYRPNQFNEPTMLCVWGAGIWMVILLCLRQFPGRPYLFMQATIAASTSLTLLAYWIIKSDGQFVGDLISPRVERYRRELYPQLVVLAMLLLWYLTLVLTRAMTQRGK